MFAHLVLAFLIQITPLTQAARAADPSSIQFFRYTPTAEADCSTVDFRQSFPLLIRNQKHISWCFAHSTADVLQYMEKTPVQISAADIAINYGAHSSWSKFLHFFKRIGSQEARDRPADTGLAKYAAQLIIPQGYCPESVLPSEDWVRNTHGTQSKDEVVEAALNMFDLQKQVQSGQITKASDLPYFYEFKHINSEVFFALLKTTTKKTLLERLRVTACTGERVPFTHIPDVYLNIRTARVFQNINASLNEQMPMTVDFFAGILTNIDAPTDISRHYHTILLYGRSYDPVRAECRYLLKDSYGADCSKYDPRLNCQDGYVSIPESVLFRTMTSDVIYQHYQN